MQEQVHFPHSYEYLTIPPAPADAGAFSMSSLNSFSAPAATPAPAAPVAAGGSDLDEAALGRLADEMQKAMEQHGKESPEFAEAQAGKDLKRKVFSSIGIFFLGGLVDPHPWKRCGMCRISFGDMIVVVAHQAHFESTLEQWQRGVEMAAGTCIPSEIWLPKLPNCFC